MMRGSSLLLMYFAFLLGMVSRVVEPVGVCFRPNFPSSAIPSFLYQWSDRDVTESSQRKPGLDAANRYLRPKGLDVTTSCLMAHGMSPGVSAGYEVKLVRSVR